MSRTATVERTTKETSITVELNIDGQGSAEVSTGIPFYDHMIDQVARHGGFDLKLVAKGDLHIDTHHTVEDVALALGEAFRKAVGDECLPLGNPAFDPNLAEHAISSFATAANITLHVTLVRGSNVHHIVEAAFKGLGRSLRDAVRIEGGGVPSTKGVLA